MKRNLFLLFSVLLCSSLQAYYPANGYGNKYYNAVMDITHDANNIYVAKLDGLVIINKSTGQKTIFSAKQGSLAYSPTCIAMHDGNVWMGTMERKLLKYDGKEFTAYDYGLYAEPTDLVFDPEGKLYVCCRLIFGYLIDIESGDVEQFSIQKGAVDGLWTGHACLDKWGALWMARTGNPITWSGLAKYTKEEGTVYPFYDNPDKRGTYVIALTADDEGGIWYMAYGVMVGKKLTRLYDGEETEVYDCPNYCNDMAFDSSQRLWMAGNKGPLLMVNHGEFTSYPCPIESQLWTSLDIDDDAIYVGTDATLLKFEDGEYTTIDVSVAEQSGLLPPSFGPSAEGLHHWFDLQGRRVVGQPQSGLYIRDGRKTVVK